MDVGGEVVQRYQKKKKRRRRLIVDTEGPYHLAICVTHLYGVPLFPGTVQHQFV